MKRAKKPLISKFWSVKIATVTCQQIFVIFVRHTCFNWHLVSQFSSRACCVALMDQPPPPPPSVLPCLRSCLVITSYVCLGRFRASGAQRNLLPISSVIPPGPGPPHPIPPGSSFSQPTVVSAPGQCNKSKPQCGLGLHLIVEYTCSGISTWNEGHICIECIAICSRLFLLRIPA